MYRERKPAVSSHGLSFPKRCASRQAELAFGGFFAAQAKAQIFWLFKDYLHLFPARVETKIQEQPDGHSLATPPRHRAPPPTHDPASVPPKLELVAAVGGGVVVVGGVVPVGDVGMVVVGVAVVDAGIGAELGISEAFMLVFESITTVAAMMAARRIRRSGCFMVTTLDSSRSFMQAPAKLFHCVRNS